MNEAKEVLSEAAKVTASVSATLNKPARRRWVLLTGLVVLIIVVLTVLVLHGSVDAPALR